MKRLTVDIDEKLLGDVEEVLDEMGLDIGTAIKVMLKRIGREGTPAFLFNNEPAKASLTSKDPREKAISESEINEPNRMTKNRAIALFKNRGIPFKGNVTFASKNTVTYFYWATPPFYVLDGDWFLILNDWVHRKLYLFEIPAKTYKQSQLVSSADKPQQIDLQIMYEDNSFTDTRSEISFAKYLKDQISY